MKRTRLWICGMLIILACCVGCGTAEEGLSEESQELVAEYAAGLLLKYNAGSSNRLLEGKALEQASAEEERIRQQEEQRLLAIEEYENRGREDEDSQEEASDSAGDGSGSAEEPVVNVVENMAEVFAMNSFSILYSGYEVVSSYPGSDTEAMGMSIDAPAGKQLVVVRFAVTNVGAESATLDMLGSRGQFRLKLQGTAVDADYTLLLDDLSTYRGNLEAGQSEQLVLMFEVEEALAAAPGAMELVVSQGGVEGEATMLLN